ncbi:TRAP transporter TatT component family protein [candidate division KSB1 bacterium]|nr:TRAP transporter TatT component family protein [candidate division KSB1 bacterium]
MKIISSCFLSLLLLAGCSIQKIAVKSTAGILIVGMPTFLEESDLPLAELALGSNLKFLEVLIRNDPDNQKLLLLAAEAYTSYTLGFIQDKYPERARNFYLRARDYALRVLNKNKNFRKALNQDIEQFKSALNTFKRSDVPALFWTANAWGSYINLDLTDVDAIASLPKVQAIMEKALELDETFYYGGPHAFLGTLFASRSRILGGDPERAKEHFTKCLEISNQSFLLWKYLFAMSYAVQSQDRDLFKRQLQEILDAPNDILPEQRLANEIAKEKAKALLEKEDELFF